MAALKPGDKALLAFVVVLAVAVLAWFGLGSLRPHNNLVVVCQTQDGFRRVDALDHNVTYTVESDRSDNTTWYNVVSISSGTVDVTEANCSNQVCVDHDPISRAGEQIVCLPHGMVVEIVEHEEDAAELV